LSVIPNGILIFFSSYQSLKNTIKIWNDKNSGKLMAQMEKKKTILVEPTD